MRVQEKLEHIKRQKTQHCTAELDRLGWTRYGQIGEALESQHHGEYVMVEVDSGDYFVGGTPEAAYRKAQWAYPNKAFYAIRIGYRAAQKLT